MNSIGSFLFMSECSVKLLFSPHYHTLHLSYSTRRSVLILKMFYFILLLFFLELSDIWNLSLCNNFQIPGICFFFLSETQCQSYKGWDADSYWLQENSMLLQTLAGFVLFSSRRGRKEYSRKH